MPNFSKCHNDARKSLCCICFRKQQVLRDLKSEIVTLICDLVSDKFDPDDSRFPSVICKTCELALTAHKKVYKASI